MCVINVTETTIRTGTELPFVSIFCEHFLWAFVLIVFEMRKQCLHWFRWAKIISFPNFTTVSQCAIKCLKVGEDAHWFFDLFLPRSFKKFPTCWFCWNGDVIRVFLLLWGENGFYQQNKHTGHHKLLSVPWNSCRFACQQVCVETENLKTSLCVTPFLHFDIEFSLLFFNCSILRVVVLNKTHLVCSIHMYVTF